MKDFRECFEDLPDPRAKNALHELREILFIALLATLCGATSCSDMALFARTKAYLLAGVLKLEYGPPSHDTFSRVFRLIDPAAFERTFQRFMTSFAKSARIAPTAGVVALDGKALRRGYERGMSHMPPVMVTAWAAQTRMALANVLAPGNNEAAAAIMLIELLQLKGCVVTADALHCHRGMAEAIVARGGDYVLAVKENQPALLADAKAAIAAASRRKPQKASTKDAKHGRRETRTAFVAGVPVMSEEHRFPGLAAVACVTSKRGGDKKINRYFLLSQPYAPKQLLAIVRDHWGIENRLHWTLDVVLDEDRARNRNVPGADGDGCL